MPATYEPIATQTLASSAGSVAFAGISSLYTDIVFVINGANSGGSRVRYLLNLDNSSNYSRTNLTANGSSVNSYGATNETVLDLNVIGGSSTLSAPYTIISHIMNYSSTTTEKTVLTRFTSMDTASTEYIVNLWRSNSAFNRIDVLALGGNFLAGTSFTLYGIKAA